ncbi:MAG: permease [Trueperaceae bacterium]|nr:permease [Trueperaceae bacterium]
MLDAAPVPPALRRAATTAAQAVRRADKALWAIPLTLALLSATAPDQAARSLAFTAESLLRLAPFLAVSVVFAAWSRASGLDRLAARAFAGRLAVVVPVAALFGAISPFCSCGVVPVVAALLAAGTPLPGVMAFWLASPLMDPEMFVLTLGELGTTFALARLAAAIGTGLLAGYATWALQRSHVFANPLRRIQCACDAALSGETVGRFWREPARRAAFVRAAGEVGGYLLVWLALAFLLESLMLAWIPADAIGATLGAGWASVPAAAVLGVPAYLNGYAAIPTVAGLMELGLPAGAGLAFMVAGGATSIPAAMAVLPLVRRSVFAWYLVLAFAAALTSGFALVLLA